MGSPCYAAVFKYVSSNSYNATLWTNLNMVAQGSQVLPVAASLGSNYCYIGKSYFGDGPASIYIDDCFILSKALSLSELTAVKNYNL